MDANGYTFLINVSSQILEDAVNTGQIYQFVSNINPILLGTFLSLFIKFSIYTYFAIRV